MDGDERIGDWRQVHKVLHPTKHRLVSCRCIQKEHALVYVSVAHQNCSVRSVSQTCQTLCLVYQASVVKNHRVKLVRTFLKNVLSERKSC